MKQHKTHKRHTKRCRHHLKRKTHRRGGSAARKCRSYENKLSEYRRQLNRQTKKTIDYFNGDVRALHDAATRAGCSSELLKEIEEFENGPVLAKANSLLRI
jgi:hypothetical protein